MAPQIMRSALCYGPLHRLVTKIRRNFHQAATYGNDIVFQLVPSQCAIIGNVLTDETARTWDGSESAILISLLRRDAAKMRRSFDRINALITFDRELPFLHSGYCTLAPLSV